IYVAYILLKAICNRADSPEYILVIATSLFTYWFIIALKMILEIDVGNIPAMLTFIMLFSAAALIGHRLRLDYKKANSLSEKLIRYDRLKDEFLAKASHELKTPLHMILNLTKNLFEGQKGTLNFKQQEDLFFVYREGQRLTRLVEDLLDAAQIKEGNLKLRLDSIKPYRMLEYILEEMEVLIPEEKNIVLKNRISEEFPALRADPDKFTQIIYNLVHNAIKYTENGGIKICASIIDDQAEIEVSDTGIGIEEKHLEEIFNTFYQENDKGEPNQGLGLGLSIVKHLVESQGGQIKAESTYGKGTTFKFTLPISQSNVDNQNEVPEIAVTKEFYTMPKQVSAGSLDQPGILVVDDEPLNQKILADILEPLKYHVFLANNGAETLEILKHNKIDLILLDYMLPDMKGDQVCREIRKIYSITELPILILTASGRTIDLMNGFEYGANDFQRKPLDVKELVPRIQSLLLMKKTVEVGLEKEFQYFYSQISPHFLYNTINTIIGLSYKDSEKARRALNNLSIYFRGKLDVHRHKGLIPLESELELATAYLDIEQMRYGEKLNIQYDIDENLRAMIPPLTLQPIVENSVRHGIIAECGRGIIKISTRKGSAGFVNITIEDNGTGMTPAEQRELLEGNNQRVGFKNVMERIKILKGASLILKSKTGEGTKVEIIVPEVRQDESYISG
ncbi:MAG TPA: ATP-binding protein, partial [Clostridia bacterium]|nr:ATP-binding protein [Clostridia bacterium]